MKQIPLTKGQFALVDDADYDDLSQSKWHAVWISKTYYYRNIYICSRDTPEEASLAYQEKKRELFGEFA